MVPRPGIGRLGRYVPNTCQPMARLLTDQRMFDWLAKQLASPHLPPAPRTT